MKKILHLAFALLLIASLSISAFADSGKFVSSPSTTGAPTLVKAEAVSEDCVATVNICAYGDRAELDEKARAKFEEAYASVAGTEDLGELIPDLDTLAEELKVDSKVLAVSDLFDLSRTDCDGHEIHEGFEVTIKPAAVENFAGLIHYTGAGWELVKCETDGENLTFTVASLSPFAIVVHDGSVKAGINPLAVGLGASSALVAFFVIFIINRKFFE